MAEAGARSAHPGGVTATVGGLVSPFLLIAVVYAGLRSTSAGAGFDAASAAASAFLGVLIFDIGVAAGMAWTRASGRGVGRYSSLFAITGSLWLLWLMMSGVPVDDPAGWTASTPVVICVGIVGLTGEVAVVRWLNQVGRPGPGRAGDRRT